MELLAIIGEKIICWSALIVVIGGLILLSRGGLARPQFGSGGGWGERPYERWPGGNARPISQAELNTLKATGRTNGAYRESIPAQAPADPVHDRDAHRG